MGMGTKHLHMAKEFGVDILCDIAGSALYAISVNMFTAPNEIAPGGVTGWATLINYLWGLPIGVVSFAINIPLLIAGLIFLGKAFTLKTMKTVVIFSLCLDLLAPILPAYTGDHLLAALFGGIFMGAGLGIVFLRGSTTGGTDILGRLVQIKMPHIQIGKLVLLFDAIVLITSTVVYNNIETALYGVICIYLDSKLIDMVIYGMDIGKQAMIISDKSAQISDRVIQEMERGGTFLKGHGAYSKEEREILVCVVKRNEFGKLKRIVNDVDPTAFIIVSEAGEVIGEGFKSIDKK